MVESGFSGSNDVVEAVRVPTQMDLDILPVGDDMTDEEVTGLDG